MTVNLTVPLFAFALVFQSAEAAALPAMTVFKTKTCGCCAKWVDHMRASGFTVTVKDVDSTAGARKTYGVPDRLLSCHTASVGGYAIEGHVPAEDVKRLLKERPKSVGLAVPGMPMGSPGMEGPRSDAYAVLLFDKDGGLSIYRQYSAK